MIDRKDIHEVVFDLRQKLDAVYNAYAHLEEMTQDEIRAIPWERVPHADASKAYNYLEYVLSNVVRQSMLTMVCSWLQEAMDVLGEGLVKDYKDKLKEPKDKKGSWFQKRIQVFRKRGIGFADITEQCEFVEAFLRVRNCIVHAGGRVEKDKYLGQLKVDVEWLGNKAKEGNFHFIEIRDGLLYLGGDIVSQAIIVSEELLEHLCANHASHLG